MLRIRPVRSRRQRGARNFQIPNTRPTRPVLPLYVHVHALTYAATYQRRLMNDGWPILRYAHQPPGARAIWRACVHDKIAHTTEYTAQRTRQMGRMNGEHPLRPP